MKKEKAEYKVIHFDLDTKKLGAYYKNYRQAYKDMEKFLKSNDFSHRQWSSYKSDKKMIEADIIALTKKMYSDLEWLKDCATHRYFKCA
jgi:virulence-associated protein VapD